MRIPGFGCDFLADALDPDIREALLCLGRKNAKSAIVAVLCLGCLCGPLAVPGWRAGVASVSKAKARELADQVLAIAEASGLSGSLSHRKTPWPGRIESETGTLEILAGGGNSGGAHSSSLDLAIVDELGLLTERDRELVQSMRSATSAKNGRFLALSIHGSGPYIPEMLARRHDPGVAVHLYRAPKDCALEDESAWRAANPGLGTIKSLDYMRHEARRAAQTPGDEALFRAHDLNNPVSPSIERICSPSDWKQCSGAVPSRDGRCVVGIDLGGSASMTAAVAIWPGSGRLETWGAFPSVPDLQRREQRDGAAYGLMIERGELELFEGRVTPVSRFLQSVASRLQGERVLVAGADRYRRSETEQALSDSGVRWPIVWRGTGASKTADGSFDVRSFQKQVLTGWLRHGDSLLLATAVGNSKLRYDGAGNPALDKMSDLGRIDALSAAVIASGLSEKWRTENPSRSWTYRGSVRAA